MCFLLAAMSAAQHSGRPVRPGMPSRDHIREDLRGKIAQEKIDSMSQNELDFQYFRAHDFDQNYKLDGLELVAALGHVAEEHAGGGLDAAGIRGLEETVDSILAEGDSNNDGFLTYHEYRAGVVFAGQRD